MKRDMNKVSKEDFAAYREVQMSGVTNMYAISTVSSLSGLDEDTICNIMENYSELLAKYGEV